MQRWEHTGSKILHNLKKILHNSQINRVYRAIFNTAFPPVCAWIAYY